MHTVLIKIIELLKSFKIIIIALTCFGLRKPSSGSSQPVLRQSYNVDIGYMYRCLKLSCPVWSGTPHSARSTHCNFGEAQAESSLMMVSVNRNMFGATIIILNDFNSLKIL